MNEVKTSVTELPESRVRVEAEVPPAEVERRLQDTARSLGRELRVPGFRKGKVPPTVVIRRVGREALLDETVRDSLPEWYSDAIGAAGVHPVGDPKVDVGDLPGAGEALTFSIEIGVRPPAKLGLYKGLEVPRREPVVPDVKVDEEIEALRMRLAKLESVDRAALDGDYVVIDYAGAIDGEPFEGGQGTDQLVGLGTGRLIADFEAQMEGSVAGEEKLITVTFPEDYKSEDLAGREAVFGVHVKDVKAQVLAELDDEFASDAAGFDTMAELREEIRARLAEAEESAVESDYREATLDAAVAHATIDLPGTLVDARAHEMWEQMAGSLKRQGITMEVYQQIVGKDEHEIIMDAFPEAERAIKCEAVLAAIVEAEEIVPAREDLLEALTAAAGLDNSTTEKELASLEREGRVGKLIEEVSGRKALELIVEHSVPVAAPDPEPVAQRAPQSAPAESAAAKPKAKPKAKAKPRAKAKPKAEADVEPAAEDAG